MSAVSTTEVYRFGRYEVDAAKRLLILNGQRVPLTPKAFDLLLVLVQRHGQVVSKLELLRLVWPDTVVEEVSLTRNISVLRKTLGEKPDEHNFIVTVPGTGYRFVATVEHVDASIGGERHAPPQRRVWLWVAGAALVAAFGLIDWRLRLENAPNVERSVPLTSYPGFERNPALSPDSEQVAFSWDGEKRDNFDIYVKSVGAGAPLRLTTNPAEDVSPVWSPDGRAIAFVRHFSTGRNELILVSALGGAERKLAETQGEFQFQPDARRMAWSPDGKWIAVSHREPDDLANGLFLVSAQTGEKRRLTAPIRSLFGDYVPAFSPDGHALAFVRLSSWAAGEIYRLSLDRNSYATSEPQPLTTGDGLHTSPVWTRDGRSILYVYSKTRTDPPHELRIVSASGARSANPIPLLEDDLLELSLGRRLVYSRAGFDSNIWRTEVRPAGLPLATPQSLIASTRQDGQARYSPDGKKIAFGSTRSGSREIWIAEADGSNPVQLTSLGGSQIGTTAWSPDGRSLAFHNNVGDDGQVDLFVIAAAGGIAKRLTADPADDLQPSYSRDGKWIYFTSKRSGRWEIWKIPAEGGDAIQITRSEGSVTPTESPDGKTLYFCHQLPEKGIWKVPLDGGEPVQVTGRYGLPFCGLAVTPGGFYYAAAPDSRNHHSIQFMSFSSGQSRPVVISDRRFGSLGVSPDERFVIYTRSDQHGSDLMVLENFDLR